MESIRIEDYREALEKAAWKMSVYYMATDEWSASGKSDMPVIMISVTNKEDAENTERGFTEELDRIIGQRGLFDVQADSIKGVLEFPEQIMKNGEWIWHVS